MKYIIIFLFSFSVFADELSDWGPFYRRVKFEDKVITTALGPFIQTSRDEASESSLSAVRPLISVFGTDKMRALDIDVVWPLGEKRVRPDQIKRRALLFGTTNKFDKLTDKNCYSSKWMFPLVWYKREDGKKNSFVCLPLYGDIDGGFTYDKSQFVLFPLYAKSQTGKTISKNIIWPFFNYSIGERTLRYRFWPFYSFSRAAGLVEHKTYMWPFIHSFKSLDVKVPGGGNFVFPFYGRSFYANINNDKQLSSETILWPFYINYETNYLKSPDKSSHRTTFWPFYHDSNNVEGPNSDLKFYWPFYGKKERENFRYEFIAWPFWHAYDTTAIATHKSRFLVPFYLYQKTQKDGVVLKDNCRIWPFYRRYKNEERSFQGFPALFPYNLDEIERNYAPIWTLFSTASGKDYESYEFLWGLIYSRKSSTLKHWSFFPLMEYDNKINDDDRSFSFLKGLFGYRSKAGENYYRLFWLPEF